MHPFCIVVSFDILKNIHLSLFTYYINGHTLIEQLKKSHYENRLPDKLRTLVRYKVLIIDEIGYPPMASGGKPVLLTHCQALREIYYYFYFQQTFSQWNEVFTDVTIASAILDTVLHHCTVINIKGESYRFKAGM